MPKRYCSSICRVATCLPKIDSDCTPGRGQRARPWRSFASQAPRRGRSTACGCRPATQTSTWSTARVLLPVFRDPADDAAVDLLAECYPDREVVPIPADDLIFGLGCLALSESTRTRLAAHTMMHRPGTLNDGAREGPQSRGLESAGSAKAAFHPRGGGRRIRRSAAGPGWRRMAAAGYPGPASAVPGRRRRSPGAALRRGRCRRDRRRHQLRSTRTGPYRRRRTSTADPHRRDVDGRPVDVSRRRVRHCHPTGQHMLLAGSSPPCTPMWLASRAPVGCTSASTNNRPVCKPTCVRANEGYAGAGAVLSQRPAARRAGQPSPRSGDVEFLHRWEELLGLMCRSGFVIEDMCEPRHADPQAVVGSFGAPQPLSSPRMSASKRVGARRSRPSVILG